MTVEEEQMPEINQRIERLVWEKTRGNVSKFSSLIGLANSNKINRLFKPDARNGKYPEPSLDIVSMIVETLGVDFNWLIGSLKTSLQKSPLKVNIQDSRIEGGTHQHQASSNVNYNNESKNQSDLLPVVQQLLKTIEKKDAEIESLKEKIDQLTSELFTILRKGGK